MLVVPDNAGYFHPNHVIFLRRKRQTFTTNVDDCSTHKKTSDDSDKEDEKTNFTQKSTEGSKDKKIDDDTSEDTIEYDSTYPKIRKAEGGQALPSHKFLSTRAVISLLQSPDEVMSEIPYGYKENVYFTIDNTRNIDRRKTRRNSCFDDICGAWQSMGAATTKYSYVKSDGEQWYKRLHIVNGKLCEQHKSGNKYIYQPCQPQPNDEIYLNRYYTKLMIDNCV